MDPSDNVDSGAIVEAKLKELLNRDPYLQPFESEIRRRFVR